MSNTEPLGENQGDTELARLLHALGRLSMAELEPALLRIRAERVQNPKASLAKLLVGAGLLDEEEVRILGRGDTVVGSVRVGSARSARWRPGEQVAGYELVEPLGRGGMGVVFRATQPATGREVALKGLLHDDEVLRARFAREAKALAAVDGHPNVVRVFEAGEAQGCAYLVLELVSGGNLSQRLRQEGRLPAEEAAHVVQQLADGVAHIHAHGILHRDIKPSNILFDEQGTPKLGDFGLARLDQDRRLTVTGQLLGTPAFMAPEQALGLKDVDERTDVYGLGTILYTGLTGVPPFLGSSGDVLSAVISGDLHPPSAMVPNLDRGLEAICIKALARSPLDRFQSAQALAEALATWASTRDAPPGRPSRGLAPMWVALLFGGVLGFFGGRLVPTPNSDPPKSVEQRDAATDASPGDEEQRTAQTTSPPPRKQRIAPERAELRRGAQVMLPVKDGVRLAWVVEVLEGSKVRLLAGGRTIGPTTIPKGGFLRDGFGVGARVRRQGDATPGLMEIRRRQGPFALVEDSAGERRWRSVMNLVLVGSQAKPASETTRAKVRLAPWRREGRLYPVVVLQDTPGQPLVRVGYLDDALAWVRRDSLRPLPVKSERVTYTDEAKAKQTGIVVGYPGPWLAEVVRAKDRARVLVGLHRLWLAKADREN